MLNDRLTGGSPSAIKMHIPEPIPPAIHINTTSVKKSNHYNNIMSKIDNALSISRKDS